MGRAGVALWPTIGPALVAAGVLTGTTAVATRTLSFAPMGSRRLGDWDRRHGGGVSVGISDDVSGDVSGGGDASCEFGEGGDGGGGGDCGCAGPERLAEVRASVSCPSVRHEGVVGAEVLHH